MSRITEQLAALAVTDTLKHAAKPASLTKLPWAATEGTWAEATGWSPSGFVSSPPSGTRSGFYLNTEERSGNIGIGLKKTTGSLATEGRQFEVWLFTAAGASPTGYQLLVLTELSGKVTYILRKFVAGAATVLLESKEQTFAENDWFYLAYVGNNLAVYHRTGEGTPTLIGSKVSDRTFSKGYCGFGGNGSNPKLINFTVGMLIRPGVRTKPPLGLDVEIETPGGNFTLPCDAKRASQRPRNLSCSTLRGDGFGTGSASLSRAIFRDHPDIGLLDTWRMVSKSGDVAYEGRLHSAPRTNDPQEQIDVALVGWMTYLKSRKINPLIIDRRLSGWGEPSVERRKRLEEAAIKLLASTSSGFSSRSKAGEAAGIINDFSNVTTVAAATEAGEAVFDAGGQDIAEVRYDFRDLSGAGKNTDWENTMGLGTDDTFVTGIIGTDHNAEKAEDASVAATEAGYTFARLRDRLASVSEGAALTRDFAWQNLRVIGRHGLTRRGTQPEDGYYISDILEYIIRAFYPKIEWAGQTNTFPLTQATWHDNPSFGYDIVQQLNNLVLWETNVWEDRKFYFEPADLTTYDWMIRTDDPGVTVVFQGDSIENFANGISVTYTDFAGVKRTIYPDENSELLDESENNPATVHGENLWTDTEVPWPCLEAEAVQFGRSYLAEFNRPKRPGTYSIAGGYIKDAAGNWHQGWKPRCSETIGIMDHPVDEPRLVTATSWNDETKTLQVTVDAPSSLLDAVVARQQLALQARNL